MKGLVAAFLLIGGAFTIGCGGEAAGTPEPLAETSEAGSQSEAEALAAPVGSRAPARQPEPVSVRRDTAPVRPVRALPEYREVTLPAGTTLSLTLATRVASDENQVEDVVRARLSKDVMSGEEQVLAAGAQLVGRVTDLERSGRVKGRARVAFRFTTLTTDGDEYDVRTALVERLAEATKGEDAKKIGIGAGAGAALGAVLGGGGGAAKGAAIGAAAGTGAVLATRGEEVRLEAGSSVTTTLTAPLNVRVRVS